MRSVNSSKCMLSKDSSVKFVASCVKSSPSSGRPNTSIGVRQVAKTIGVIGQCHRYSSESVGLLSQLANSRIMICRDELENEFLGVLKENLRIGIVCKCAVSAHEESVTPVCTRLHAALGYMYVPRDCIVQDCEHETFAECYACAGRENHFGQMCFGRFDVISL